jgi:hypothetical protein
MLVLGKGGFIQSVVCEGTAEVLPAAWVALSDALGVAVVDAVPAGSVGAADADVDAVAEALLAGSLTCRAPTLVPFVSG